MSWSSKFSGWGGRFSPFGRTSPSDASTKVTDADYSYITSEDIAREQNATAAQARPARDTDSLLLKHRRVAYPVHFPAYSIDDGELTIGKIRAAAATRLEVPTGETARVKLFYRGKNLKDDARTAKEEGMRSDARAEILLVLGEKLEAAPQETPPSTVGSDDEESAEESSKPNKKKKRSRKRGGKKPAATPSSFNPDATFAPTAAPPPPRPTSARPPQTPQTAMQKLDELASVFHRTLVPQCVLFISSPPPDQTKREFDHKRLTETILAQVILKLDAVDTDGDAAARQRRKELVKETQGMLNQLDAVMKG